MKYWFIVDYDDLNVDENPWCQVGEPEKNPKKV